MVHWDFRRSASSMRILLDLGVEQGVEPSTLLASTGLSSAVLALPATEVEAHQELQLVRNLLRACPSVAGLGTEAGVRYHITSYGMLGYALMSSSSLRRALALVMNFSRLSFLFAELQLTMGEQFTEVRMVDTDIPDGERQFLVERDMAAGYTLMMELYSGLLTWQSVSFRCARPSYAPRLEALFGCTVQFGAEQNAVRFANAQLDLPLPQAHAATANSCEKICRELLNQRRERSGMAARVRLRLLRTDDPFPALERIADEFGMTSRNLRRHLQAEGVSFRDLLSEARLMLAEELLSGLRMPVADVAERLGYAEASSFILAFKRWKGLTPAQFARPQGHRSY